MGGFFVPLYIMNTQGSNIVRIGLIGIGNRGMATIRRYRHICNAKFTYVCDHDAQRLEDVRHELGDMACVSNIDEICRNPQIDLVYICTNWDSHAQFAIEALRNDKDVALEIPAATTLEDCERLRKAAEQSKGRVFMLENCCFDPFHLGTLGMAQQGLLGELTHLEGGYIHYLGDNATIGLHGNPYPTHGIGPVAQLLGDDSLASIVSINGGNYINSSLLTTEHGKSILLQFDETTPRPYSRLQTVCGTAGYVQKYPQPVVQLGDKVWTDSEAEDYVLQFVAPHYRQLIADGKRLGVENLMNYIMDRELISAVRNEHPFDISLDEALLWSSVIELTAISAANGGQRVMFP